MTMGESTLYSARDYERRATSYKILLQKAKLARRSMESFFDFVMREETSRRQLKILPFQRVIMSFVQAHEFCVLVLPVGFSKTFITASIGLYLVGNDPTLRGCFAGGAEKQAMKPLAMVRDYIESNERLNMVFKDLKPSPHASDPWTQHRITVARPRGIRDATFQAIGLDGHVYGSRLNFVIADDLLTSENTSTKEQRDKVHTFFDSGLLSRLDPRGARVVVCNTPFHPDDLVHRLEEGKGGKAKPTLRMTVTGDITVRNAKSAEIYRTTMGYQVRTTPKDDEPQVELSMPNLTEEEAVERLEECDWDTPELRPKYGVLGTPTEANICRLTNHDPDPAFEVPLWPEKFGPEIIAEIRTRHLPQEFNRLYMCDTRDDGTAMCKIEFIESCKTAARAEQCYAMVAKYNGSNPTFTGVDLAVSPGEHADKTAYFTFEARPDGTRVILDIEIGQWDGPTIVRKIFQKQEAYKSIVRVENNGSQEFVRQFALQENKSLPIKAHTTTRAKGHPEYGVPGLFLELSNGAWLIPNSPTGGCHPMVTSFINSCLFYVPTRHTDDILMAAYFAREQAREWGCLGPKGGDKRPKAGSGNIGANILSR